MMFFRNILAASLAVISLSGCGDDRWHDYSYKMTVWLGEKSFSTVRHVKVEEGATIQASSGRRVDRHVQGQAVIVETPSGPVFALLTPEKGQFGNGFYAAYVAEPALVPAIGKNPETDVSKAVREYSESQPGYDWLGDDAERHNAMLEVEGPHDLPRTIETRALGTVSVWPMFVRFGDIANPKTVRQVTPEAIGVTRITIEVTDDDATTGIDKLLVWLSTLRGSIVKPMPGESMFNIPAYKRITEGDFSTELFESLAAESK